jgi:hypothetical protein
MMGCKGQLGFFYIKWKEGEREQVSGDTVCVRGRALRQEEDSAGNKIDR